VHSVELNDMASECGRAVGAKKVPSKNN